MGNGRRKKTALADFQNEVAENKKLAEGKPLRMEQFFLARINEREEEATNSIDPGLMGDDSCRAMYVSISAEQVLRECWAYREILTGALLFSSRAVGDFDEEAQLVMRGIAEGYVRSLRYLVATYSDHEDFNPSWVGEGE